MDFGLKMERIKYVIRKALTKMLQWETQDDQALLQNAKTYLEVWMKELDNLYWQLIFDHDGPLVNLTRVFDEVEELYEENRYALLLKLDLGEATNETAQFGRIRKMLKATEEHNVAEMLESASISFAPAAPHFGGNGASVSAQSYTSEKATPNGISSNWEEFIKQFKVADKKESTPHIISSNWEKFKKQFEVEAKKDTEDEGKKEISDEDATINNLQSVDNDVVGYEETYTQKDEQLDVDVLINVDVEDVEAETRIEDIAKVKTIAEEEFPAKNGSDILIIKDDKAEDNILAYATAADEVIEEIATELDINKKTHNPSKYGLRYTAEETQKKSKILPARSSGKKQKPPKEPDKMCKVQFDQQSKIIVCFN